VRGHSPRVAGASRLARAAIRGMLEVRIFDNAEVRAYVEGVRRIHGLCFPEDVEKVEDADGDDDHGDPDEAFWDRLTACHDADDVLWFLLLETFEDDDASVERSHERSRASGRGSKNERSTTRRGQEERVRKPRPEVVVGFAAATRYARCAYGMHLAVDPRHRRKGHGAWLMREVQSWAFSQKFTQMQASVDVSAKKLVEYYRGLGATIAAGLSSGAPASSPTVIRIARDFDETLCASEIRMSRERGESSREGKTETRRDGDRGKRARGGRAFFLAPVPFFVGGFAAAAAGFLGTKRRP